MDGSHGKCDDTGSSSSSGELVDGTVRPAEVRRLHSCSDLAHPIGGGGSSSSSGDLRGGGGGNARPADARSRSYGDILTAAGGGGKTRRRRRGDDDAYQKRWEPTGYVSFEDLIGTSSFWDEPHASETASRLGRPRNRRIRSPGPLGTRRGSAMHGLVKKYVNPFIGFPAGIFCCTVSP